MNYGNMTDEEIITLIRSGNHEAMDYLLDKYRNMVKRERGVPDRCRF